MNKRLTQIKQEIEKKLEADLPISYRYLDYNEPKNISVRKVVPIEMYATTAYFTTPHFKPISKVLTSNDEFR